MTPDQTPRLSQWWPAPFTLDGVRYATAEHWMMAGKARLFNDPDGLAAVLAAASPGAGEGGRPQGARRGQPVRPDLGHRPRPHP